MAARRFILWLGIVSALHGAPKKEVVARAGNDTVEITATALADRESIKQALTSDLGGYFVVVDVRLAPKGEKITVRRDDFLLRTDRDGEKARPFAPSQIAGKGALVVSQTGGGGGIMGDSGGPVWGGYPGTMGRPSRIGGDGGGIGSTSEISNQASVQSGGKKESPLMQVLTEKVLPEKDTDQPVSGLLYFSMEPKQKLKDLELIYTTESGKLSLRFR